VSDLQAIATLYGQMDLHLRSLRDADDRAGEDPAPDPVDEEQRINDQAYFVLAWGQLEEDIEEACREDIDRYHANGVDVSAISIMPFGGIDPVQAARDLSPAARA